MYKPYLFPLLTTLLFIPQVTTETISQEVASLPSCSIICLATAVAVGGCSSTDYVCQCGSASSKIRENAKPCLESACSAADIATVSSISTDICNAVRASSSGSSVTSTAAANFPSYSSSSSSSSSTTSQNTSNNAKKGLSTGASIGIGIGVGVGSILLLALLFFFMQRYRKRGAELRRLAAIAPERGTMPKDEKGAQVIATPLYVHPQPTGNTMSTGDFTWVESNSGIVSEADGRNLNRGGNGTFELQGEMRK